MDPLMDVPVLAGLQKPTYGSFVRIQNVVWKTYWERWMLGTDGERERESGKSALAAQLDDDIQNINTNDIKRKNTRMRLKR